MSYYTSVLYLILQIVISNAAPTNESKPQFEPVVINGTEVKIEEYPFFAHVQSGNYSCGGTIISDRWILTAAHCIDNSTLRYVFVGGERLVNSIYLPYKKPILHPLYDTESLLNDIALIELQEPLQFSAKVQPAKLPKSQNSSSNLVLIARGLDEFQTDELTKTLKKMDLLRMSPQEFKDAFLSVVVRRVVDLFKESVFYGTRNDQVGPGACQGDSGSPVLEGDTVVGVVSYGFPTEILVDPSGEESQEISEDISSEDTSYEESFDCKESIYAAYTNVGYFRAWITSITGLM